MISNIEDININGNKKMIDVRPGDKNIDILVILIQQMSKNKLKNDKQITQFLVADDTGSILCNFYDSIGDIINEGDIILLTGAYASVFKNHLILYSGKSGFGRIIKVDEYFMTFSDTPNLSEVLYKDKDEQERNQKYQSNSNKHYDSTNNK